MRINKKCGVYFFVFSLLAATILLPGVSPADELTVKQKQLQKLYQQLNDEKKRLQAAREKEWNSLQRLVIVRSQLDSTRHQLNQTRAELEVNEKKLGLINQSLAEVEKKLDLETGRLKQRLQEVYKSKGFNYLEMVFTSRSLSDFINRSYYFERLLGYDVSLVSSIQKYYGQVKQKKQERESVTAQVRDLASSIQEKETFVRGKAVEENQLYAELRQKRLAYQRRVSELRESSRQIESMIQRIIVERQQKGVKGPQGTGRFMWPLSGTITSAFGWRRHPLWGGSDFHTGIDIAASYGTPIAASDGGEVIFSGWWGGYGKCVIIDHGGGLSTLYGHMSRIYVQKGKNIGKGQTVGLIGSTGYSTGPHLHFEVRKNGTPVNPRSWLP